MNYSADLKPGHTFEPLVSIKYFTQSLIHREH